MRLGILGNGQLGRMSALAAQRMGIHVRSIAPTGGGCMAGVGDQWVGDWHDPAVLSTFADGCDAITVESEWAPADLLVGRFEGRLFPRLTTLETIRHKGRQKAALVAHNLSTMPFVAAATLEDAQGALAKLGSPVIVKKFEGSYDGFGNARVADAAAMAEAFAHLAGPDGVLVEAFCAFTRELAVMVARDDAGATVVYPVVETEQRDHRCHRVTYPAPGLSADLARRAQALAVACAEAVDLVGVLGVELFETVGGELVVNELAPRPHNTGHYTIEACRTSQFENHVRTVLGLPLGSADPVVPTAVMINVIGTHIGPVPMSNLAGAVGPHTHVHIYGKEEVRPKRKMGHVTVTGSDPRACEQTALTAAQALQF